MARFVLDPSFDQIGISNLADPLSDYADHRKRSFRRQIRLGVDPYQNRYRPLSSRYAKQKAKKWGRTPILWASGRMVKSHQVTVRGNRIIESLDSPAAVHATGGRKLPQRSPLPDSRGLPESDVNALWNSIVDAARRSF